MGMGSSERRSGVSMPPSLVRLGFLSWQRAVYFRFAVRSAGSLSRVNTNTSSPVTVLTS